MTALDRTAVDALLERARLDLNILREHRRTSALSSLAARCAA